MPDLHETSRNRDVKSESFKNNVLPFPSLQAAPRDPMRMTAVHVILAIALFGSAIILGWCAILTIRSLLG